MKFAKKKNIIKQTIKTQNINGISGINGMKNNYRVAHESIIATGTKVTHHYGVAHEQS